VFRVSVLCLIAGAVLLGITMIGRRSCRPFEITSPAS
jgi:hypothetical protein